MEKMENNDGNFSLVFDDSKNPEEEAEKHIERMLYIYNCIMNGWTVRKVDHCTFEFKKDRQQEVRDIYKRFFSKTSVSGSATAPKLSYLDAFLYQMMGKKFGN